MPREEHDLDHTFDFANGQPMPTVEVQKQLQQRSYLRAAINYLEAAIIAVEMRRPVDVLEDYLQSVERSIADARAARQS